MRGDQKGGARRSVSHASKLSSKPLLSVDEAAILLGETRSTLYRAIKANTLPLPVYVIGRRLRIPRRAVERLVGGMPLSDGTDTTTQEDAPPRTRSDCRSCPWARRRATCSAARRSSSGTASV